MKKQIIILLSFFFLSISQSASAKPDNCRPFFDYAASQRTTNVVTDYNQGLETVRAIDVSPEPIPVEPFGRDILEICGAWGSKVDHHKFVELLEKYEDQIIIPMYDQFRSGISKEKFITVLAKAWMMNRAFEHVFCGQPKKKIGGLHYHGRYYDLQQRGDICILPNNSGNEEVYPNKVYTLGVWSSIGNGHRKKSYSPVQRAEDIFVLASRTYMRNCEAHTTSTFRQNCVVRSMDGTFTSQMICKKNKGLVTFYPVAKLRKEQPSCF